MDPTEKQIKGVLDECTLFYKGVVFRQEDIFLKRRRCYMIGYRYNFPGMSDYKSHQPQNFECPTHFPI